MATPDTHMEYVKSFMKRVSESSHIMINQNLPKKLGDLDQLLGKSLLSTNRLCEIRKSSWRSMGIDYEGNIEQQIASKAGEFSDKSKIKVIESNRLISELLNKLCTEINEVLEICNTLRMWITLLLPKIEDGSNFGRSVLEEAANEIQEAECQATTYLNQISSYFTNRAKIASKIVLNPHIVDFFRYIVEEDEKQYVSIRLMIMDIRNNYSSIQDLITKNIDIIKNPASSSSSNLY